MIHLRRSPSLRADRNPWRSISKLALLGALAVGCSREERADHAHDEHTHTSQAAHDDHAPKTDPHHVAENRTDCEDDVTLPAGATQRYGIEVASVREMELVPTITAPGHLAFPQHALARVGSAVPGRVVEVRVHPGEAVSKGDVLLVIESPTLGEAQSDYLQKRTMAATAAPTLELVRAAHARAKELYEEVQGITLSEVQRREAEVREAERELAVARAAQTAARNRLVLVGMGADAIQALETSETVEPRFAIAAPIAGRVIEATVTLGELVDPEKDRLLVIGDLSTLWAIAEVSETRFAEIVVGAPAKVIVPALQNAAYRGNVAAIAPVLEAAIRTVEARVEVPNPDGALLPGMFIQVEIDSSRGAKKAVLAVPDAAVLMVEGRPSVFVPVDATASLFCKHEIEVGTPIGDHVPVLAGLAAGDLVVVSGAFLLKAEHGKASAQHEH